MLAVLGGADIVRVHDVAETVQALRVMAAIRAGGRMAEALLGSAAMSATYAPTLDRADRTAADGKDVSLTARSSDYRPRRGA